MDKKYITDKYTIDGFDVDKQNNELITMHLQHLDYTFDRKHAYDLIKAIVGKETMLKEKHTRKRFNLIFKNAECEVLNQILVGEKVAFVLEKNDNLEDIVGICGVNGDELTAKNSKELFKRLVNLQECDIETL